MGYCGDDEIKNNGSMVVEQENEETKVEIHVTTHDPLIAWQDHCLMKNGQDQPNSYHNIPI